MFQMRKDNSIHLAGARATRHHNSFALKYDFFTIACVADQSDRCGDRGNYRNKEMAPNEHPHPGTAT